MKRSGPPQRRTALRADPEKVREFHRRAAPLDRGDATLKRSEGLGRGNSRKKAPNSANRLRGAEAEGPLKPAEWKRTVWLLDKGFCVGCGRRVPPEFNPWIWQAHHPIEKQKLPPAQKWDPRNGVLVCTRCHERHTTWTARIPLEKLPARCLEFARELGDRGVALIHRYHPPGPGGGEAAADTTNGDD